jgi:hypothetical protein
MYDLLSIAAGSAAAVGLILWIFDWVTRDDDDDGGGPPAYGT